MSQIIYIDRTNPFDAAKFCGAGCRVIDDERSALLTELDISTFHLFPYPKVGRQKVRGEERLRQARALEQYICLGANVFEVLWGDQDLIPKSWEISDVRIFFDGTTIVDPIGDQRVICLYRLGHDWDNLPVLLKSDWGSKGGVSAVVPGDITVPFTLT